MRKRSLQFEKFFCSGQQFSSNTYRPFRAKCWGNIYCLAEYQIPLDKFCSSRGLCLFEEESPESMKELDEEIHNAK